MNMHKLLSVLIIMATVFIFASTANAGSLTPSAPPAPTMKSLDDIHGAVTTPNKKPIWSVYGKDFVDWPANPRFAIYDGGTANFNSDDMVLDKETGLVWARDAGLFTDTGDSALYSCIVQTLGGRMGWRLPTVEELLSLIDPNQKPIPLPIGHPFINVKQTDYWTSTEVTGYPGNAYTVMLVNIYGRPPVGGASKSNTCYVWPVRGPQ